MSKKFLATIALAVASLFVFTACGGENYHFEALANTPAASAEVKSNGGIYIQKGEYSYFLNAAEDGTGTNTFGKDHKGRIVRCKTSDLLKADRVVETVVPKIIYAEDPESAGFSIYGDKIYYTTPNVGKDTSGTVQLTKMDFMMANLNGTGTKLIATIEDNTKPYRFVENGDKVYIVYSDKATVKVNGEDTEVDAIYQINTADGKKEVLADNVASFAFDSVDGTSKTVAYTKNVYKKDVSGNDVIDSRYNVLYQHTVGGEADEIAKGYTEGAITFDTMKVVALKNDVVYYNVTTSVSAGKSFYKAVNGTPVKLANQQFETFMVAGGAQDAIYTQAEGGINKVVFANGKIASSTKLCSESESIKFEYEDVANNRLYYSLTESFNVKHVDTNKGLTTASESIFGTMETTTWASFDFATIDGKTACLFFNDIADIKFINYMYASIWEDAGIKTYRLGLLTDANKQYAIEEGDDKYAVEKFTA